MATIYFLTIARLEEISGLSSNIDDNDIKFNIRNTVDSYIVDILGTYFYNDLLTKYNNQTMSSDELLLLDRIQMAIVWGAYSDSYITMSAQLKNKGPQDQSGDFSSTPEFKKVAFVSHHYADRRDKYLNTLKNYLLKNKDLFPNFTSSLNDDSILKNCGGDNLFTTGIIFI